MHAAVQHLHGTMAVFPMGEPAVLRRVLRPIALPIVLAPPVRTALPAPASMSTSRPPREFFIQGITLAGKPFRPSDWAERLAGALSSFRPKGAGIGAHIGYSPYCVPRVIDGTRCVIVSEALRDLEPMAWDFVMHFARDNELQVVEACLLPDPAPARQPA